MKMKSQTLKFLVALLGIPFLMSTQSFSFAADKGPSRVISNPSASQASCQKEKADFKKLYIELQKSLNYEGKDAFLDAKGNVALKAHAGATYEGKVFEEALFKEYQNSLRKVALMYQAAKFDSNTPAEFSSNPVLVDFIKAIDGNDGAKYISGNNINTVIEGLQKASVSKYPVDSKFRINENDKYLLKKLLTHAQDRLCSIEKYQETGKRDRNFTAEELEKKKNAPLNQLILAVKDAKITKDSDIKLENIVDEKVAINSAIAANINALTEWMKKNKSCLPVIKSAGFMNSIQAGIQQCNYRKFVDALSDENVTNIESILHFINSNEKFLKGTQAKAETAMDEMKLQAYVDRTFANLSNKINCTEVTNSNKDGKRLFVRNLPYMDEKNKFDTSKISCKVKIKATKKAPASEKILTEQECSQKIELISDELGRGLEVKQKNPKESPIAFSIKENPDCTDIDLVAPVLDEKTAEMCKAEGEALTPKRIFTVSNDKKSCMEKPVEPPAVGMAFKTLEMCKAEGEALTPKKILILSADKKSCVENTLKTNEMCKAEGEKETPPKDLIADKEGKTCIPKDALKTDAICKAEGEKETPPKDLIADKDGKTCIAKEALKTDAICKAEGEKQTPPKDLVADQEGKSCIEKKKEEEAKPEEKSSAEKECEANNAKLYDPENGRTVNQWQVKDGKCIDTKADKSSSKSKDTEKDVPEAKVRPEQPFTAPARFVPIQIPTRQMYILPGMP